MSLHLMEPYKESLVIDRLIVRVVQIQELSILYGGDRNLNIGIVPYCILPRCLYPENHVSVAFLSCLPSGNRWKFLQDVVLLSPVSRGFHNCLFGINHITLCRVKSNLNCQYREHIDFGVVYGQVVRIPEGSISHWRSGFHRSFRECPKWALRVSGSGVPQQFHVVEYHRGVVRGRAWLVGRGLRGSLTLLTVLGGCLLWGLLLLLLFAFSFSFRFFCGFSFLI